MPPKNKKKSAFFFFMKEVQDIEAAKGYRMSMIDAQKYANPRWLQMSLAEREPYEVLAKKHKNNPNLRGGKLASDGTRVEDYYLEMEELERKETAMKQEIKAYVQSNYGSEEEFIASAPSGMYYFISFNILCQTEKDQFPNADFSTKEVYIPIEVGAVEYSLQYGIHREYHTLIHPGQIPTGYAGQAKARSDDKHKIDIFGGEEESERDFPKILSDIKSFVNPNNYDEYPPLFCNEEVLQQTIGCLEYLAYRTRDCSTFEVWNVNYLLLELLAGAGKPLPSKIMANDLLTKPSFNYHSCARCHFHEEKDNHYCALAYSKRLCYLVSDATALVFNVTLTERHIPTLANQEKNYVLSGPTNPPDNRRQRPAGSAPFRLDQRGRYYSGAELDQFADVEERELPVTGAAAASVPRQPRQPASTCIAVEMTRLKLQMTSASAPGHGIGRGQPWNQK